MSEARPPKTGLLPFEGGRLPDDMPRPFSPTYKTLERTPRRKCVICEDPVRRDFVANLHLRGYSFMRIEELSRSDPDVPSMKRETIAKHLDVCVGAPRDLSPTEKRSVQRSLDRQDDVASLVQQEVIAKLKAGEARVTVQHGLQAQALLDRREERAKDRELAINLARILHISPPPPHLISARPVIEGDYERVEDDDLALLAEGPFERLDG